MREIIHGDCLEKLKELQDNSVDAVVTDPPYGLSFMGKKWDYDVPSTEIWQECLRVLKPGGYLLAFAGTRTQHRMAVRIEDAGFEIRDMIAWVYGSGFPKSRNITLDMDKMEGHPNRGHRIAVANRHHPDGTLEPNGEILPSYEPKSDNAKKWNGWGTALKPALEPITVARKPLSEKTVAENVLKWGTGGINIDESRVKTNDKLQVLRNLTGEKDLMGNMKGKETNGRSIEFIDSGLGRFPANLIHDGSDEVVSLFPNSKGAIAPVKNKKLPITTNTDNYKKHTMVGDDGLSFRDDSGPASRFFYCAKASKSERNKGCEELKEKKVSDGREKEADNAFQRGKTLRSNTHPTVKPIALMEYLVKLVSRDGAVILDPFAGSGSTLLACKNLKRDYIGIEKEEEYIKIIEARLSE